MFLPALVALLVMAALLLFFAGLAMPKKADVVQTRLTTYAVRPRTLEEIELQQPLYERVVRPIVKNLSAFISRRTPQSTIEQLRRDLMLAGNPNDFHVNDFLGVKGLAALAIAIIALLLMVAANGPLLYLILLPLICALPGFYLPNFWLKSKITARHKEIQLALPDCLDLLTISVEAGLGFDAAMQKVAEKWDNALTEEFDRVIIEVRIGKQRREALRAMALRCDVQDVTSFIAAIIQADQLGVSIARILNIQAEQMRMKRRQRAEKLAHEAPIKMLIPMAFFMLPTIYIVILGPMVPQLLAMMTGG
ncbi:MAG: type II secretion system F family protein [Dehalococcoidia bacterium]|nr:type II secretion system F family protein [Dehalococcoidia bacterium]